MACVVEATDEWANIVRSSLRRQKRLVGREDQSYVCLYTILVKPPDRFEPLACHRALNNDIAPERSKIMSLPYHALRVLTHHLKVHGSLNKSQNVRYKLDELPVLFRDERRVGDRKSTRLNSSH